MIAIHNIRNPISKSKLCLRKAALATMSVIDKHEVQIYTEM